MPPRYSERVEALSERITIMVDHPGWYRTSIGFQRVLADDDGGLHLIRTTSGIVTTRRLGGDGPPLVPCQTGARDLACAAAPDLARQLAGLGTVGRFATVSLWDALATAIIRQVVRADQATKLYRQFSHAFGEQVDLDGAAATVFPGPHIVLGLTDQQFADSGMAFKRHALRSAAEAFLKNGIVWRDQKPTTLVTELQEVRRIGPWTAGAVVADWSGDFSLYPFNDLAVRTWARRAAPTHPWPDDEAEFGLVWRELAGDRLSDLTLLTLAWGKHSGEIP